MAMMATDTDVVSGRLEAVGDGFIELSIPGTSYRLRLAVSDAVAAPIGQRMRGTIHAKALRMHKATAGGLFIEPIAGSPRIIQGRVQRIDEAGNRVLMHFGVPMWIDVPSPQKASSFTPGDLANFYVESGTSFSAQGM